MNLIPQSLSLLQDFPYKLSRVSIAFGITFHSFLGSLFVSRRCKCPSRIYVCRRFSNCALIFILWRENKFSHWNFYRVPASEARWRKWTMSLIVGNERTEWFPPVGDGEWSIRPSCCQVHQTIMPAFNVACRLVFSISQVTPQFLHSAWTYLEILKVSLKIRKFDCHQRWTALWKCCCHITNSSWKASGKKGRCFTHVNHSHVRIFLADRAHLFSFIAFANWNAQL